ncbi:MAG: hypothetical protein K2O73_03975 [Lachnospiraceae bacterium]|nr:hypothetical protein [Lachnospiraceae bacterium]MDE7436098.1 hypothetical protein [Lachnospiraceae bacterium]
MMRVTGSNSLLMTGLSTEADNDTLLNALKKDGNSASKTNRALEKRAKEYSDVKNAASDLQAVTSYLSEYGEELLNQILENNDRSALNDKIKSFVSGYNNLLDQLEDLDTSKADRYMDELKSIISGQSELLSKAGIALDSKNRLSVDEEKLSQADTEDLKKLITGENSVVSKVADRSMYIGANAVADQYVDACSNYNSAGTSVEFAQMTNLIGSYLDSLS